MFHYAILRHPHYKTNGQFLIVGFQYLNERDTFIKHTEFEVLPAKERNALKRNSLVRLCAENDRIVFNQDKQPVARIDSLYKCISKQRISRPEDSVIPNLPKERRWKVINKTNALRYNAAI